MLAPADLLLPSPPDDPAKPHQPAIDRNIGPAQVMAIIGGMASADVAVLAAFYGDGQRQREIADTLGISQGEVSKRLNQARRQLASKGVVLPDPHQLRATHHAPKIARCEPAALDQLVVDEGAGVTRGRWVRGSRRNRDE